MEIETSLTPVAMPVIDQNEMASIVDQLMTHVVNVQKAKGGEYSGSKNALAYFQTLGVDTEVLPEKVVWIFLNKHLGSIRSYLNDLNYSVDGNDALIDALPPMSEPIEGRIVDAITYLCLFAGLVQRRRLQSHILAGYVPTSGSPGVVLKEVDHSTGHGPHFGAYQSTSSLIKLADELTGGNTAELVDAYMSAAHAEADNVDKKPTIGDLLKLSTVAKVKGQSDTLPSPSAECAAQLALMEQDIEPMADREAFTPAPTTVVKAVSYDQIVQQQARLTTDVAGYGMFIRLLFDQAGNVVDPTQPGADITSSKRYRVVAQVNGHLVVIGEQGKVQTLDTATTACYFYTDNAMYPVLPTLGQGLSRDRQFIGLAPSGSDWTGIAQLALTGNSEILYTDMNVVAAEVNGA